MSLEDAVCVFEHLRGTDAEPGAWRLSIPAELTPAGQTVLSSLNAALAGFDATSQPWIVLATLLLDRTRQAARIASSASVSDQAQGIAIWQFMNFVRAQPNGQGLPIQRLSDRVRRLLRLRDDRDLRQLPTAAQGIDAVRLMTIHGSKGLEFPAVHIAGVNRDSIPGALRTSKCPRPQAWSQVVRGAQRTLHGRPTTKSRSACSTSQCPGRRPAWRSTERPRHRTGVPGRYRSSWIALVQLNGAPSRLLPYYLLPRTIRKYPSSSREPRGSAQMRSRFTNRVHGDSSTHTCFRWAAGAA